jgi:arylsulfatase A-like enzyme/tetratricopeptide (TPR) repeat protein
VSPVQTPAVDDLATQGTVFLQAVTPAPITLVAHASLFTGRQPPSHGVRNNGTYRLGSDETTLAEVLGASGWRTGAFVGATVLDARYGLDQGFDHYDDGGGSLVAQAPNSFPERRAPEVVQASLAWLDQEPEKPAFVWVHLFDPHFPYDPPEPERSLYAANPYDGEIAYTDRWIGALLDGYEERDRLDRTTVVLASDHGEGLNEHGEPSHGLLLYDSTIHVPLVIRIPGTGNGQSVQEQVQLVDVFPTVLSSLGIEGPEGLDGRDLGPLMRGDPDAVGTAEAYAESWMPRLNFGWSELRALRTPEHKLILGSSHELYDLVADASERVDLAQQRPGIAGRMERSLQQAYPSGRVTDGAAVEMDAVTRQQFRALGYVWDPSVDVRDETVQRADPKQLIGLLPAENVATEWFDSGFFRRGIDQMREVTARSGGESYFVMHLTDMLFAIGDYEGAATELEALVSRRPTSADAHAELGLALERLGRGDDALRAYATALRFDPRHLLARAGRWDLLQRAGRSSVVAEEAELAIASDPDDGQALAALAVVPHQGNDPIGGLESTRTRLPRDCFLTVALADALAGSAAHSSALPLYQEALEQSLDEGVCKDRAAIGAGRLLLGQGQATEAIRLLAKNVKMQTRSPELLLVFAEACAASGDQVCATWARLKAEALEAGPALVGPLVKSMKSVDEQRRGKPSVPYSEIRGDLRAGRVEIARAKLERHWRRQATTPELALLLAEARGRSGDAAGVRAALSQLALRTAGVGLPKGAVKEDLAIAAMAEQVADTCWSQARYLEALQAWSLAAAYAPAAATLRYNAGLALERLGRSGEALARFEEALALDPELTQAAKHRDAWKEPER